MVESKIKYNYINDISLHNLTKGSFLHSNQRYRHFSKLAPLLSLRPKFSLFCNCMFLFIYMMLFLTFFMVLCGIVLKKNLVLNSICNSPWHLFVYNWETSISHLPSWHIVKGFLLCFCVWETLTGSNFHRWKLHCWTSACLADYKSMKAPAEKEDGNC